MQRVVADESPGSARAGYPLGYSELEFKRLEDQAAFLRECTEDFLRRAGIEPGMRVLDIGSGVGDVALLAGTVVGSSGSVLGIDRSTDALAIAAHRAAAVGLPWVRFQPVELDEFTTAERFDAVIGRLVLLYQPDPVRAVQRLCNQLRPGGIIAFQEFAMPLARCVPEGPEFRRVRDWILGTFERAGCDPDMGTRLLATFVGAGLPAPELIMVGRPGGGPTSPAYDYVAGVLRSLLPVAERLGVTTAAEVDIDTLADRLRREVVSLNACVMPPPLIGAWSRTPDGGRIAL